MLEMQQLSHQRLSHQRVSGCLRALLRIRKEDRQRLVRLGKLAVQSLESLTVLRA